MGTLNSLLRRFRYRPPGLSRRDFLKRAGYTGLAIGSGPLLSACGDSAPPRASGGDGADDPPAASALRFDHGVASGDPLSDRVILWTRVTPAQPADGIAVDWQIATTPELDNAVRSGRFITSAARDYTVKLDVDGLASYSTYYYQFAVTQPDGSVLRSPIGRTRTAPRAGDTDRLRFVSAACANYTFGYFNGYAAMALRRDVDAVLFLGDYLYETGASSQVPGRDHFPAKEIVTLEDYRQRHAQYKTDPDLQAAHRQHPWICVWDDHETTNNSYSTGADNHQPDTEGDWKTREGQAIRAYFEWMPIRDRVPNDFDAPMDGLLPEGNGSCIRRLAYGELVDLLMLDTRLAGRVLQNGTSTVTPEQTILGEAQRNWLLEQLRNSTAQWKLVGQQVTFAPIKVVPLPEDQGGTFLNEDAWDGYRFDRNAVMQTIADNAINNVVVLSGDIHSVVALDLPIEPSDPTRYNPFTGEGSLAVEFCCNGIANVGVIGEAFMANNPHLKYANLVERGYLLLDITAERVQGEYYYTGVPQTRSAAETFQRALATVDGANRLSNVATPSSERDDAPVLAP